MRMKKKWIQQTHSNTTIYNNTGRAKYEFTDEFVIQI